MLLGAWLLHSVRVGAALGMAIAAMRAPAVTRNISQHSSMMTRVRLIDSASCQVLSGERKHANG